VVANKKRKTFAPGRAKPSVEVVDEVQSSHKLLQLSAAKRKPAELSTSDGVSEPASRRPAPSALAVEAYAAVCTADELTASISRQLSPMEVWRAVICGLRFSVESYFAPNAPLQCKRCQRFAHSQRNCGYPPRCVSCGEAHISWERLIPKQQLKFCSCGGNHTCKYRGCLKWRVAKWHL
jgi:hypothetical protein